MEIKRERERERYEKAVSDINMSLLHREIIKKEANTYKYI